MEKSNFFGFVKKIHFIGINGVSMSGLAKFSALCGKKVTGSDEKLEDEFNLLEFGVIPTLPSEENVKFTDLVVYSSAIKEENIELSTARKLGVPIVRRSEFLGMVLGGYKKVVAISGSHGKTTTTAMISNALVLAKKNPLCFIGGNDSRLKNFVMGSGDIAVAEACEYKSNFLDIFPTLAVVLNIDNDHLDSFGSIDNEISAFQKFIKNTISIINADDKNSCALKQGLNISFGIKNTANFKAFNLKKNSFGCFSFGVRTYSIYRGRINLKVAGLHNVYNALATIATLEMLGIDYKIIKRAIEGFCGVERRQEFLGTIGGINAFADYAHHPTEIRESLKTFMAENNCLTVFQPHTYSRTEFLMSEFVAELCVCKKLVIYKTYPARERFNKNGSSYKLYRKLEKRRGVFYAKNQDELKAIIEREDKKIDKILFLGAGDIYKTAKNMIDNPKKIKKRGNQG